MMIIIIKLMLKKVMKIIRLKKKKIIKWKSRIKSEEDGFWEKGDLIGPYGIHFVSLVNEPTILQYLLLNIDTGLTDLSNHYMKLGWSATIRRTQLSLFCSYLNASVIPFCVTCPLPCFNVPLLSLPKPLQHGHCIVFCLSVPYCWQRRQLSTTATTMWQWATLFCQEYTCFLPFVSIALICQVSLNL